MAKYNEILVGRFNRALQKLLQLKGEPPSPQLGGEITPTLDFTSFGVEDKVLVGWQRFAFAITPTAGAAGQANAYRLRNPSGSNVVGVVEKAGYAISTAATAQAFLDYGPAGTSGDLTTILSTQAMRLDNRGAPQPVLVLSNGANTPAALTIGFRIELAIIGGQGGSYDFIVEQNQELAILPGDFAQLRSNALAFPNDNFWIMWRERFLEESERT